MQHKVLHQRHGTGPLIVPKWYSSTHTGPGCKGVPHSRVDSWRRKTGAWQTGALPGAHMLDTTMGCEIAILSPPAGGRPRGSKESDSDFVDDQDEPEEMAVEQSSRVPVTPSVHQTTLSSFRIKANPNNVACQLLEPLSSPKNNCRSALQLEAGTQGNSRRSSRS